MADMDDERLQWADLDPLVLSGEKLKFLMQVQAATGSDLRESQEILQKRYDVLRTSRPDEFRVSHEEYWEGFYS